jgi:hypothetical protein
LSLLGFASSFSIPKAPAPAPALKINANLVAETWFIVKDSTKQRDIFLSILGISWF